LGSSGIRAPFAAKLLPNRRAATNTARLASSRPESDVSPGNWLENGATPPAEVLALAAIVRRDARIGLGESPTGAHVRRRHAECARVEVGGLVDGGDYADMARAISVRASTKRL
jgi:hypothetical protein